MLSCFTIRTNSLRFPIVPTSSTGNFWFCSSRIFQAKCRNIRCNREPCKRTQINLDTVLSSSALLMHYSKILNIFPKVMINDWLILGNIIVYLRLFISSRYESKITFQILICLCWSRSFAPIHQNLKFWTWVQVITVLKIWYISLCIRVVCIQ